MSTVSKALNGYPDVSAGTIKRVSEAAKAMGYRPNPAARKLVTGRSRTIGIVLPLPKTNFIDPFFSTLLAGASHRLLESDYLLNATAIPLGGKETERYESFIEHGHHDGLILIRTRCKDNRIKKLLAADIPFVCYGRSDQEDDFAWLDMDNRQAFHMAINKLLELGHSNIAILNASEKLHFAKLRKMGALAAFEEAGLTFPTHRYQVTAINENAAAESAARLLQDDPSISAILCSSDTQALGAMFAARKYGRIVGKDIAVIGCDNNPAGTFCAPPLTSIQHGQVMDIGRRLADMVIRRIEGTAVGELQVLMEPQWVWRESVCRME